MLAPSPSVLAPDWAGETVFIIAGGPSVAAQDLSLLAGRRIIAVNSSFERLPQFGGSAPHLPHVDLIVFGDVRWWNERNTDGTFTYRDRALSVGCPLVTPAQIPDRAGVTKCRKRSPPGLSDDPTKLTMRRTTLSAGINVATFKAPEGAIVLIGADGHRGIDGRRNHYDRQYNWRHIEGCWDRHHAELATLVQPLADLGILVINASPGSAWADLWPVMSLQEAISTVDKRPVTRPKPMPPKHQIVIHGMFGIGDCIQQRAVLRELMKDHTVWLETYYIAMYHDLVAEGLRLKLLPDRIYSRTLEPRYAEAFAVSRRTSVPHGIAKRKLSYHPADVRKAGSIMAAQFASVGLTMPERPDFSLPVRQEWRDKARAKLASWRAGNDKPLLIYRPIVLNKTWHCPSRSPDPAAYDALYRAIREKYFVVSIANLGPNEWIVGPEADVDVRCNKAELDFETMAGLFAEASMVFANPGMAPSLGIAVGTPTVVVYGGHESAKTTLAVASHLAPVLHIEPDNPCGCHQNGHDCDKTITIEPAIERLGQFARQHGGVQKTLIFATTYIDTAEKLRLLDQWLALNRALNPTADLLIVDSASPFSNLIDAKHGKVEVFRFPENIGHLSKGGRDGWGRAFCRGLDYAVEHGYDYVAHIEGDSLFRHAVAPIIARMRAEERKAISTIVSGMKYGIEKGWVETGLMFFSVDYLRESKFTERYDWPNRTKRPTPEAVIGGLLGDDVALMPWSAERGDRDQITPENVKDYDWITHCPPAAADAFANSVLSGVKMSPPVSLHADQGAADAEHAAAPCVKLNFGCGANRLDGWQNYDAEVDITKRLKFKDASADFIFSEHCVEHVDYYKALAFFKECRRVLKPGGIIRIAVPSIERVWKMGTPEYFTFARRWAPSEDARGAMHALLYSHGHKAPWTHSLLEASLFYSGFENITTCRPCTSAHKELTGVEGHHRIIGEAFNEIETVVVEGTA